MRDDKILYNITKKINKYIDKLPKSGFHLTLAYNREYKKINNNIKKKYYLILNCQ